MNVWLLTIPLISAFIGYFIVWMIFKILFHPIYPVKFPGLSIQGIFPKYKEQLAESLGTFARREFLNSGMIEARIADPDNLQKLMPVVEEHIDSFLHSKLPKAFPMLSMFIGEKTIGTLKNAFMEELNELFPQLMQQYAGQVKNNLDLEKIVREKISSLSTEKLENSTRKSFGPQIRLALILAALFGFFIGLLQLAIVYINQ